MKNQKGFSLVVILLALLLFVAVSFTGYFVYNTQNEKNPPKNEQKVGVEKSISPKPSVIKLTKYCSTVEATCIEYPETWKKEVSSTENDLVTITTPKGSVISFGTGGQKGGACVQSEYPNDPQYYSEILYAKPIETIKDGKIINIIEYIIYDTSKPTENIKSETIRAFANESINPVIGKFPYCDYAFAFGFRGSKGLISLSAEVKSPDDRADLIKVVSSYE